MFIVLLFGACKKNDTAKNDNNNGIGRVNIDYNVYNFK